MGVYVFKGKEGIKGAEKDYKGNRLIATTGLDRIKLLDTKCLMRFTMANCPERLQREENLSILLFENWGSTSKFSILLARVILHI